MPHNVLSATDYAFIRTLRTTQVLADIDKHKLRATDRVVPVACADGDRTPEMLDFHRGHIPEGCMHNQLRHGGPLMLAKHSPLAYRGGLPHCECYLMELKESCEIKNTRILTLYPHFPCSAAKKCDITAEKAIDLTLEASEYLKEQIDGADVRIFVHIDYNGYPQKASGRFKTYFFEQQRYKEWKLEMRASVAKSA